MTRCAQRSGFLTLFTCGAPATAVCMACGKEICALHLQVGTGGANCPDCAVLGLSSDEASRRGLDSSYNRQQADSGFGTSYSATDYGSFETFAGEGGEMDGGGASDTWNEGDDASGPDSDAASGGASDFQDS